MKRRRWKTFEQNKHRKRITGKNNLAMIVDQRKIEFPAHEENPTLLVFAKYFGEQITKSC